MQKNTVGRSAQVFALTLVFLGISEVSWAQRAQINGRITDTSSAVIIGARITVSDLETGVKRTATSNQEGYYAVPLLQEGNYRILVEMPGFKPVDRSGIKLNIDQTARVDFMLDVGEVTEVVKVEENASPLNFDNAEVKGVISPETIQELPLLVGGITRSAVSFVKLLPGVTEGGGPEGNQFNVRINGGMTEGDEAVLDGVSSSDGALGQSGILLQITGHPWSPEAISEVSVLTSNYEPQYGATTSSVTTAVTKSGTNEFHGSLYEFHRNTVLNARQYSKNPGSRPKDIENEYGGTIGGPIRVPRLAWSDRRKTYGFFNYTGFTLRGGITAPTVSIPSLKQREGDFTDWRDAGGNLIPVYDPATTRRDSVTGNMIRDQFMGCDGRTPNVICRSDPRLQTSLAKQWFRYLPTPTNSDPLNNYTLPVPLTRTVNGDTKLWDMRIDHLIGDRDRFFVTWHYYASKANVNETVLPKEISANGYRKPNTNNLFRANWDHIFSSDLLNSLNLGYNNILSNSVCVDAEQAGAVPKIGGVVSNEFPPNIRIAGFAAMGCNGGFNQDRPSYIVNNLLSWVKGKHTLKFGGEYRNQQVNNETYGGESGTFNFSRANTGLLGVNSGSAVASFLLGAVDSASLALRTAGSQYARQPYLALYAGDTWKATSRLSLNYGLRWDLASPVTEKHDVLSFFDPHGPNAAAGGRSGRLAFAGTRWGEASLGKSYPESIFKKALAPRVGLALTINPETVLRAGYGMFFTQLYYTNWTGGIGGGLDGFNSTPSFSSTDGGITPAFYLQNGFPTVPPSERPPFISSTFRTGQSIGLYRGAEHGRPPYAQQWNLTIERQLTKETYVTAAYVANKGTRLISGVAGINALDPRYLSLGTQLYDNFAPGQASLNGVPAPYPGWASHMTGCAASVAQALLPYPQYCNSFYSINENAGSSTFHSFQAKLERRFSAGLWILGSYTLSKLISNSDDVQRIDSGSAFAFSPFERERYKSLSTGDVPHSFSGTFVYELPLGKGKRFLSAGDVTNKVFGGWQLTSIFTASSGIPYIFRSSQCNVPAQFRAGCVPAILPGANPFAQKQGGDFDPNQPLFNVNAFEPANGFNFYTGKGSRSSNVRGFPYYGHQVALIKDTRLAEKLTFQVRGEFFNVWNWHRFVYGGTWGTGRAFDEDVSSPTFGKWTGAISKPRNIQVGAKLIF